MSESLTGMCAHGVGLLLWCLKCDGPKMPDPLLIQPDPIARERSLEWLAGYDAGYKAAQALEADDGD